LEYGHRKEVTRCDLVLLRGVGIAEPERHGVGSRNAQGSRKNQPRVERRRDVRYSDMPEACARDVQGNGGTRAGGNWNR
jgi:hypothetical protein